MLMLLLPHGSSTHAKWTFNLQIITIILSVGRSVRWFFGSCQRFAEQNALKLSSSWCCCWCSLSFCIRSFNYSIFFFCSSSRLWYILSSSSSLMWVHRVRVRAEAERAKEWSNKRHKKVKKEYCTRWFYSMDELKEKSRYRMRARDQTNTYSRTISGFVELPHHYFFCSHQDRPCGAEQNEEEYVPFAPPCRRCTA